MEKIKITVSESTPERLDRYVAEKCSLSRSQVLGLIQQGVLFVNAHRKKPCHKVKAGDQIELSLPEPVEVSLLPEPIPLEVLWEDPHIIVLNKPAGMVVYPAPSHERGTLLNALLYHCGTLSTAGGAKRPGIVHRLDKDTSGVMVVAKSDMAYQSLIKQFRDRVVRKHYRIVVDGNVSSNRGQIKASIGRSRSDRKKMSTRTQKGKEALTSYEVIERYDVATFLDVVIATGRTHQIRVHFASQGKPVLGDRIYGKKSKIDVKGTKIVIKRQMVHAFSLEFMHPQKGGFVDFSAPLPEDMAEVIQLLQKWTKSKKKPTLFA